MNTIETRTEESFTPSVQIDVLQGLLQDFVAKANAQKGVSELVRQWDRQLRIEPNDESAAAASSTYLVKVSGQRFWSAQECPQELPEIFLRGPYDLLCEIFAGEKSPVECFFSGEIECFASDEDQVKLDCLCVLLWGV